MLSNNIDEPPPPYLVAGTEVSAKFKGAFCEAKITRVDKNVRCKITYKHNGQQATVSDEQIRSSVTGQQLALNEFKIGMTVSVAKTPFNAAVSLSEITEDASASLQQLAMLIKVFDQSSYTVIFNDGDEKILRRSFIRFKGEKHYLDSETLNNAPLNNPEHFLYPIKHNNNADAPALSPSLPKNSSSTKSSPSSAVSKRPASVTNISDDDESQEEEQEAPKEIKKPKKQAKRRTISKEFEETEEQEEERIAHDLEPQNNSDNENNEDSDTDSDDSSSSDDYPSEVKDRFVAQLYKFMDDRGTPMNRLPTISCVDIDLHRFFIVVRKFGGYNKVCKLRNWIDVYKRLNLPNVSHSSNVINLKCAYKRYLQPFEDFYRKLGSMCDLVSRHTTYNSNSAKRNTSDSHRSLQLFKNRVFTPNTQKKALSKYKQKQVASSPSTSTTNISVDLSLNEVKQELSTPTISNLIDQRKESIDSTVEVESISKTDEKVVNIDETTTVNKSALIDDQQPVQTEEITLSSMVRNLNENFKKAKRQEKEKKEKVVDDDSVSITQSIEVKTTTSVLATTSSSTPSGSGTSVKKNLSNSSSTKTKISQIETKLISKKKPSSSSVSSTASSSSFSSSSNKNSDNTKATPLIEVNNNDFDDDDSLDEKESKPKRKVNRLSASGSDETQIILETKKKLGMKRKNSTGNCSLNNAKISNTNPASSSNTETNDESENDNHITNDVDLNESEYKMNLTITDLEVNKLVDVKYANGSQKKDYRAKIVQINMENHTVFVHYLGWNTRYDEWVKMDRIKRMINENYNSHKRRKSSKLKSTANQSVCSPSSTSSLSSHLNESPSQTPNANKSFKKSSDLPITLLKKNERSSSSSTTSSLCDQIKDELLNESTSKTFQIDTAKLNKTCSSDSETKNVTPIELKSQKIETEPDEKINTNADLITGDSLLSIKEEIIESETISIAIASLPIDENVYSNKIEIDSQETIQTDNNTKLNEKTDKTKKPNDKLMTSLKIETTSSKSSPVLTPTNSKDKKNDNQENNKSQNIKSPTTKISNEPNRQIIQPPADKILNNQTNCLNENHVNILESEDEVKKKIDSKVQSSTAILTNEENTHMKKNENSHASQLFIDNCKYSVNLNDVNLIGKQRIRYIEEQMRLCREAYAKLKTEIATIDRKKKKLKRSTYENNNKSVYSCLNGITSSSSSTNNDDSGQFIKHESLKAQKN